jgi:hypothetical protein
MEAKVKRKYVKRDVVADTVRKAKCGHITKEGRYFKCEKCLPQLDTDDGDWNYFNLTDEE